MSISGDCVASLVSKFGFDSDKARSIVADVIDTMNDANFAGRFASDVDTHWALGVGETETDRMLVYWDVIKFLRRTQT